MALETLQGIKKINGQNVVDMMAIKDERPDMFRPDGSMHYHMFEKEIRPFNFIYVRHDVNSLSFTIQNGPIKEVGVNGCQVEDIIAVAKTIIEGLNAKFPSRENSMIITKLDEAIMWSKKRTADREARQVEGTSQA